MFERFSEPARAVLVEAQDLAVALGSDHINVGHILYGCTEGREETAGTPLHDCGITPASIRRHLPHTETRAEGQVDPQALSAIGIDYQVVLSAIEETFGPGALEAAPDRRAPAAKTHKPRFTPEAKRSLELALRVAIELSPRRGLFTASDKQQILPGHLLLGLLRLDNELLSNIIADAGTTVAALSAATLTQLTRAA